MMGILISIFYVAYFTSQMCQPTSLQSFLPLVGSFASTVPTLASVSTSLESSTASSKVRIEVLMVRYLLLHNASQ